jgi:hypothetical protein
MDSNYPTQPNAPENQNQGYQAPPPVPPAPQPIDRRDLPLKSTVLTVVLSVLMPGLGQVYVGYYRHAFLYVAIFASTISILASDAGSGLEPLLGVFLGFFYFYQLIDAGRKASIYNQILLRGQSGELDMEELPTTGGSTFGGVALLIIGVLALSHNVLDYSMAWLEDWWPLALIIGGGWVIYKSRGEKKSD